MFLAGFYADLFVSVGFSNNFCSFCYVPHSVHFRYSDITGDANLARILHCKICIFCQNLTRFIFSWLSSTILARYVFFLNQVIYILRFCLQRTSLSFKSVQYNVRIFPSSVQSACNYVPKPYFLFA